MGETLYCGRLQGSLTNVEVSKGLCVLPFCLPHCVQKKLLKKIIPSGVYYCEYTIEYFQKTNVHSEN